MSLESINITETIAKIKQNLQDDKSVSLKFRPLVELLALIIELLINKVATRSALADKGATSWQRRLAAFF